MKARDLIPLFTEIVRVIPSLAFHKRNLAIKPTGQILRAIHVDPSGFSKDRFNLVVFMMPLCVPEEFFHFTFGKHIYLEAEDWSMKRPNLVAELVEKISREALPFLAQAPTLLDFAVQPELYSGNPHGPKAAAYSFARIGETRRAIAMIEDYLPKLDLTSVWQKQIADDSRALRHLLIYEPELAAAKLEEWENQTIRTLKLERFR